MALDSTRVIAGGLLYSFGSVRVKIDGDRIVGFTEISYDDKRTRAKGYGSVASQGSLGKTRGKYEVSPVKLICHAHTARALFAKLAEKADDGKSFGNTEFSISVEASEAGLGSVQDEIFGCHIESPSKAVKEGPEPNMVEITVDAQYIVHDGFSLFDNTIDRVV